MIDIYPYGVEVEINNTNIRGYIGGITIRSTGTIYEVKYFYEGKQEYAYLEEHEFSTKASKTKIGFKP